MQCSTCKAEMKPLFNVNFFCPNDCGRVGDILDVYCYTHSVTGKKWRITLTKKVKAGTCHLWVDKPTEWDNVEERLRILKHYEYEEDFIGFKSSTDRNAEDGEWLIAMEEV